MLFYIICYYCKYKPILKILFTFKLCGGPGIFQTEVWALTAYNRALNTYFANAQWGYGSAFAVVLVVIGVLMATIYMRVFNFDELVAEPKIEIL